MDVQSIFIRGRACVGCPYRYAETDALYGPHNCAVIEYDLEPALCRGFDQPDEGEDE